MPERPDAIPPDYDERPERFRLARSVLREHALPGPVIEGDATALPYPDGSFGSVALLYVL